MVLASIFEIVIHTRNASISKIVSQSVGPSAVLPVVEQDEQNQGTATTSSPALSLRSGSAAETPRDESCESSSIELPPPITMRSMIQRAAIAYDNNTANVKKQESWHRPLHLLVLWLAILFLGIIAGMVGLGGGSFLVPMFLELGLHPQTAAATSTLCVLAGSFSASVTFALYDRLNLSYVAVYGPLCFLGGFLGVFAFAGLVRKYRMASLLAFLLSGLMFVSVGLIAGFALRKDVQDVIDGNGFSTASFCEI